jgi:hypothetical protein
VQLAIADKLLQTLGTESLVVAGLQWGGGAVAVDAKITPRLPLPLPYQQLLISNRAGLDQVVTAHCTLRCTAPLQLLNLPLVAADQRAELFMVATGSFVIRRAHGILTSMRCVELLPLRRAGLLGNLREYHELCCELPQVLCCATVLLCLCDPALYWLVNCC